MASVEIVTIGTEILLGHLVDTNSVYVAGMLADHGVDVYAKHSVGDNTERLAAMLADALERADGVITTGGLGPTVDDLTKDAVAKAVDDRLEPHEPSLRALEERFRSLNRPMSDNNRRQAILPSRAHVMPNPNGTAPGFIALRPDGKFVACMPGVPREMKPMLADQVIPWLVERFHLHSAIYTKTLHTIGIGESELDRRVEDLFRSLENPKIAMLAHGGRVDVKVMAKAESQAAADAMIAPVAQQLRERIGAGYYGDDDTTPGGAIVNELFRRGKTIGVAESVTGGGVAEGIVAMAGASRAFRGGIVAYDNAVKQSLLGVRAETLAQFGAVSEETALEMARGARAALGADFALATTGVAGPDGGSADKPVGLVWFALVDDAGEATTHRGTFPGSRADVLTRASMTALSLIWRRLELK
ncbi:MAG TPA: competence/damage-inducible protein A [Candidatus Lustribacter sp.]|nr:competence/damage-inducible protein A [Candidatus Lustribacter sp.]